MTTKEQVIPYRDVLNVFTIPHSNSLLQSSIRTDRVISLLLKPLQRVSNFKQLQLTASFHDAR